MIKSYGYLYIYMYNILWWEIFNIDPEILIAMVRSYPLHLQEPDPGR